MRGMADRYRMAAPDAAGWGKVLFLCAVIAGCFRLAHPAGIGFGRGFEMAAVARNLAERGAYANPFAPAMTGPTALVPPLYTLFLAGLIRMFESPLLVVLAACIANIAANAFTAALLPKLAGVFFGDWRPGVFAGALWICAMPLMPQWDVSCTIAGTVVFCLFTAQTGGGAGSLVRRAAAAGIAGGAVSLLNPATVLVSLPWTVFLLCRRRVTPRYAARYGAIFLLAMAAPNAPWLARNYAIWHRLVVRTSFGATLYSSNNDCAQSSLAKDTANGCFQATNAAGSANEVRLIRQMGEVEFDRSRVSDTWNWIRSHPDRFRQLTGARMFEFWFPRPVIPAYAGYAIWLATALSIPGLVMMARKRIPVTVFVLSVWLLYPPLYYVVVSSDRYRDPILWTSLLPAGYFLAALSGRALRRLTWA